MTAESESRSSGGGKKNPKDAPAPVSKALLLAAWLIPGIGHSILGKRIRAGVFAAVVIACFTTGVLLNGEIAVPQESSPLSWFFTFGCLGNGLLYFIRLLWVNGLHGILGSSFPYGLQGGGDPVAAGFFYGKTFLYTAGLMNLLLVLDVSDIARGDKD